MKLFLLLIVVSFAFIDATSLDQVAVIYYPDVTDILQPREINIA